MQTIGGSGWRRNPLVGYRCERWICSALLVLVPLSFYRGVFSVFYSPKVTLVWLGALLLGGIGLVRVIVLGLPSGRPRWVLELAALLACSVALITVLSPHQERAWTGVDARWSGGVTYLAYAVILVAAARAFAGRAGRWLIIHGTITGALVATYGLFQAWDLDPFDWATSTSFGLSTLSTYGNPNFSSAFIAITIPLMLVLTLFSGLSMISRGIVAATFGIALGSIGHMGSLQGQIASATGLLVLAAGVISIADVRRRAMIYAAPYGLALVAVPLLVARSSAVVLLVVVIVLAGWSTTWRPLMGADRSDAEFSGETPSTGRRQYLTAWRSIWVFLAVVPVGVLGLMAGRDRLSSALGERIDFWGVAVRIFMERPVVGLGLETFGFRFGALRSTDHSDRMGSFLSDSAHSVPLGLLAGGGLVLVIAYGLLVVMTAKAGVAAVRRTEGEDRLLVVGLLSSWTAFHLQSLVSVDLPGLGVLHVLFAGALFAQAAEEGSSWAGRFTKMRWSVPPVVRWPVAAVFVLALFVGLGSFVAAPIRADRAHHQAMVAIVQDKTADAERHLLRGVEILPDDGALWLHLAWLYRETGNLGSAQLASSRAAALRVGDPVAALLAARDAALMVSLQPQAFEDAISWYETAIEADPHGPTVREGADFFELIGRANRAEAIRDGYLPVEG